MTPVFQTQFVATHGKGNCVQSCIASLLDLHLDSVPAFREVMHMESAIDDFLVSRGLRRIAALFTGAFEAGDVMFDDCLWHPLAKCYLRSPPVMAFGKSPRNSGSHAVVGHVTRGGFDVIHDPHPDATGIVGHPTSIHWIVRPL
jgi:hypothetical protein